MTWTVVFIRSAERDLDKLPQRDRQRIFRYLRERVLSGDPRRAGHPLHGRFAGLWSYRVGDYRLIASILDSAVTVTVVRVGNRRDVYE